MTDISTADWSETDGSNTSTPPNGWPAGMLGSQVEPAARAIRGAIKRWYDHANATVVSGGTVNAQTLTYTVAPAAYVTGDTYVFIVGPGLTNTNSMTLNVNGLGAIGLKLGANSLSGHELVAGALAMVAYDGTNFQLLSAQTRQLISFSSLQTAMVAGSTNYMGLGAAASEAAIWHIPPFAGRLKNLRVDLGVAPGAAQTVTATVMVAGVASGVTCTVSGAGSTTASDSTNQANVTAEQSITIRLVYSAGAASSSASGRVEFDNP